MPQRAEQTDLDLIMSVLRRIPVPEGMRQKPVEAAQARTEMARYIVRAVRAGQRDIAQLVQSATEFMATKQ